MEIQYPFLLYLAISFIYGVDSTVFTIKNNCPFTIAPATLTSTGASVTTGFELASQASNYINMPNGWSGRVWARFGCSNNGGRYSCSSGDCGSGQIACNGTGAASPATLVEFTLVGSGNQDFYDVSLVEGFNLPVYVVPQGRGCLTTDCPIDINAQCPSELAVRDGSGGTIGCKSACVAFNQPQYCCTGDQNTPETCPPTNYSMFFKNLCPKAYSYAYDDSTSTFTCPTGPNYLITFCSVDSMGCEVDNDFGVNHLIVAKFVRPWKNCKQGMDVS